MKGKILHNIMTNNKGDDMAMKKFLSILLSALMAAVMLSVPTAAKGGRFRKRGDEV